MKRLALPCLLILAGICGCEQADSNYRDSDVVSRVVKEFKPSWLFEGECQPLPLAKNDKPGMRTWTGVIKTEAGKPSVDSVIHALVPIATAKLSGLGAKVCGSNIPSVNPRSKTAIIRYQTPEAAGAITIALQLNQDSTAISWILVINEDALPAKAPGGG